MKQSRIGASFALLAVLLAPLSANPSDRGKHSDDELYGTLAKNWLDRNQVKDSPTSWSDLIDERFGRIGVGLFDVRVPPATLRDAKALKDIGVALVALLDAQAGWESWVNGTAIVRPDKGHKDDPVAKWLLGLSPKLFAGKDVGGADLAELGEAPAAVREALTRLQTEHRQGKPFGVERELADVRLALFPQRAEFTEFVCVIGSLDPRLQPQAWCEGIASWLEYQGYDTHFLTLEYQASDNSAAGTRGIGVGDRNPAALGELVTQVAIRALLARISESLDPALVSGMANALVIDLYGELDTRIDGDVRSRSSQGTSTFVPGGNPDGGTLPATSAENRWRGSKGRDHFVGILSQVQKQSGKKADTRPGKLTSFELVSDDGSHKSTMNAPFLGPKAVKPPTEVFPDYLELVRCYGVAFLHWLRVAGASDAANSSARFGDFLRAVGRGLKPEEVPGVLQGIYGQPLSGASPDEIFADATLEGRFLAWLSKQG
jgi:hypothetical protein